ncbi:MAG: NADP(H)-dependent aldo-keto reductase [Proteobacteria bacterium]|nr:NADP(H)-dependent aldo-keto reductase [Pseudomonadota bacterium]
MNSNRIGNSELVVSEICLGTMTFGEQNTESEAHEQLDYATANGVNFIDAAEMYPVPPRAETQGLTESYVGSWLKRQKRDKLVIASKVTGPGRGFQWVRNGAGANAIDLKSIETALDGSLRRLQTDYIDLYQIHWPDRYVPNFGEWSFDPAKERSTIPIVNQLEALETQVKKGKIRYIGLSNETPWGILEFLRIAKKHKLPAIVSTQNAYNLLNRSFESGLSEVSHQENVPLLAYSPLAFGHLTGKYFQDTVDSSARLSLFPKFGARYEKPNVPTASRAYAELAEKYNLSPAVLAVAFVCSRWFVASNIIGATNIQQLKENLTSAEVSLAPDLIGEIDNLHLRYTNPAV